MTIEPDYSTIAGLLNQLVGFLAEAAQVLLAIKVLIADQTKPPRSKPARSKRARTKSAPIEPEAEDRDALMRMKDDGCPNGD